MTDQYCKEEIDTVTDEIFSKENFQKFEWENLKYEPIYNAFVNNAEKHYLHPGVMKNVKKDKLLLSL
ncbi:hypothetical protein KKH43_05970 [Patescibacteria group bacterium]|nr:hypothetical protein [Patescibacteria group bacterium]